MARTAYCAHVSVPSRWTGDEVAAAEPEPAPMDGVSGVADMDTGAVAAMTP